MNKKTRTTIVVSNGRYTFHQKHVIKYTLSNTVYQIPFIKSHLSNAIYQIPFIKCHLSNTIYQIPFIKCKSMHLMQVCQPGEYSKHIELKLIQIFSDPSSHQLKIKNSCISTFLLINKNLFQDKLLLNMIESASSQPQKLVLMCVNTVRKMSQMFLIIACILKNQSLINLYS